MLKLNASYSKKVPAETEYSSQSYHCTIEVELPDGLTPEQLNEKVHGVFDFVRTAVEAELHSSAQTAQIQPTAMPQPPVQQLPSAPQAQPQQPAQQAYAAPQAGYAQNPPPPQQQYPQYPQSQNAQPQNRQYRVSGAPATEKQVNYLLKLAKRAGLTVQQILQRCQIPSIEAIPSRVCSQLIQELTGAAA